MTVCIDTSGLIYTILVAFTQNVTGSFFLTTFLISLGLMVLAAMFSIPIEYSMILLLPFNLGLLACLGTDWLGVVGTILIYLGILLAKHLFKS